MSAPPSLAIKTAPPAPFTVTACANPQWANAAHDAVNCQVTFSHIGKPLPFCAMASDPEPHGQALFDALIAGKYGPIADYVAPVQAKAARPSAGTNKV